MKYVKKYFLCILCTVINFSSLSAGLIINEVASNTQSDWVELKYVEEGCKSIDISSLYVTMYYGSNEPLATEPVTLYSCNRESTPYDDRFVVVHLTDSLTPDETDRTGDTNNNNVLDLYCNNYSNSLWNSDCVVAIDSDDDPSNGGIVDFISFSNRDGSPNTTIEGYHNHAVASGEWNSHGLDFQFSSIDIGKTGLASNQTIIRKNDIDTNSKNDFVVTQFVTPGQENVQNVTNKNNSIIKVKKRRIFYHENETLQLLIYKQCSFKIRIFTSTGMPVYNSKKYSDIGAGHHIIKIPSNLPLKKTGLYLGTIEASVSDGYGYEVKRFYIIYRK